MHTLILPLVAALLLGADVARSADQPGVTYTISAAEALNGPKPADPNYILDASAREASIRVDAGKLRAHVNPLVFGACFEDLNHEIYGGLYAQMIFGESFEEGPEKELPPGWRLHADWLKLPTWEGMWCSENGAIGMTGFRWYKLLWEGARFEDGTIQCELMQPAFDPGRPIGLVFRASGPEFREAYTLALDARARRIELRIGDRGIASAAVATGLGEWMPLRVDVQGGHIRVFAGDGENPPSPLARGAGGEGGLLSIPKKHLHSDAGSHRPLSEEKRTRLPLIDFSDSKPLPPGLVGFDASESHGWFRRLKIETGGKTYTPPLAPPRTAGYRGPVSQWWDPIVTGNADARFGWDADNPFNSLRSQKIEIRSGPGTAGVANRGLHRFGLSMLKGRAYQGRLYLRGSGEVTVALQSADGGRTYASQRLTGIDSGWKKFPFTLRPDATDHNARFAVCIDKPGAVWIDQVVLTPTGDGLFKGLPVRADIARAVVDSGVTCIRMGGDFSGPPGYKWKTMLGDPDQRPQYNSCWYPFETRGWSIVEFVEFCRAAGIEPIPCLNPDESPADVAELVVRYRLKYVQLGNGCPPAERLAAVADAMHAVDPSAKLLSGSIGHVADVLPGAALLREIREKLAGKVHAMAMFPYNFEVTGAPSWQAMLDRLSTLRGALKVYSQEVNGGNHNLLRGLADAAFCNVTERNADFVDIVTYCGMLEADRSAADNGWDQGRIFFNNHRAWLQPHAWTIRMAREHYQPLAVETTTTCAKITFKNKIDYGVPAVDVLSASAARSEKGDALALKVVNLAPFALKTTIDIAGMGKLAPTAKTVVLTGGDLKLENTAERPDHVVPVCGQRDGIRREFVHVFPAYSYTILDIKGER